MRQNFDVPTLALHTYLFSMTVFKASCPVPFSVFPVPFAMDKTNNWQKLIQHSPVSMVEYYISKLFSTLLTFLLSIIVVFCWTFRSGVNMPMMDWLAIYPDSFCRCGLYRHGRLASLPPSAPAHVGRWQYRLYGFSGLGWAFGSLTMFPDWRNLSAS